MNKVLESVLRCFTSCFKHLSSLENFYSGLLHYRLFLCTSKSPWAHQNLVIALCTDDCLQMSSCPGSSQDLQVSGELLIKILWDLSKIIKHVPARGPPFRVTFCSLFPGWGKAVDSHRRSCRNTWASHGKGRGVSSTGKVLIFPPLGKGGQRRHKMVITIWCMCDSPRNSLACQHNSWK